jgi:hypothetical protein
MVDARAQNACNRPYQLVVPEHVENYTGFKPGDYVVFAQSTIHDITDFKTQWPKAHLVTELRNKFGQAVLGVYQFEE